MALLLLGVLAWGATNSPSLVALEHQIAIALQSRVAGGWHEALRLLSTAHRPRAIAVAGTALIAALAVRLGWRRAGIAFVVLAGGIAANDALKHLLRRPRPGDEALGAAIATDFAFPSGHVANATLLYGIALLCALPRLQSAVLRAVAVVSVVLLLGALMVSRVVLGAHRPADVAGGLLLAVAWLALAVSVTEALRGGAHGAGRAHA